MEFKKYINKMMMPCVAIAAVSICVLSCSDIGGGGAAIGGGSAEGYQNCGNIVIKSGTVRAEGKALCAAIGSSKGGIS